ncbi:N-acetylgalactosamine-N,N'-diacetylbacillosaminyl-diphospho-undecaprenol 4-alpha-N-acetylgalactosaminyltransferase [Formosa sp. Hel1_31_208]|uniref:glycosyltransferase n=1 Tax=Formosa sp. Hel1_31_208 TaxID=1798225 RepID=UPI00087D1512|nr:glycosyltransferase [Formosa sp. Hel1_31_208]SDS38009.1 N-acetylgalactosamine-N,N'-diacetylbacillosaminyl-diphospho-undecaprenol 4-alpha-N-acetylgalactosaminyltransferase [Formosa sp. Hel1_31_208]
MSQKPKLSILTIDYGTGGTERFISLLLPELIADFEVTLVIFYNYVDYEIPKEVNLIILKPNTKKKKSYLFKIKNFASLFFKYRKFIQTEQIDISFALLPIPNIINSLIHMSLKNVRTVISERCYPSLMYQGMQLKLATLVFPIFYNKNDALFSNSEHINADLKSNFGVKIPMNVIYNPIDTDDTLKVHSNVKSQIAPLKLVSTGRMYSAKNQKLILEAIGLLDIGAFDLTIFGIGQLSDTLTSQAKALHLEPYFHQPGKVSDIKDRLIQYDCFILSSNTEGFPNVLLEALSVGLPVISTNCLSGPLEMLNDNEPIEIIMGTFFKAKYGILVNVNDALGLSKAIQYYSDHPDERQKYSKLAFERAKSYNMYKIYNQVRDLLMN